jgi:hypothetical protein
MCLLNLMNKKSIKMLIEKIKDCNKTIDSKILSLQEANDLSKELTKSYIESKRKEYRESEEFESKEFKDRKNSFFNEFETIRHVAMYLKERGEEPESIQFCAQNQSLGYDGIFKWSGREVHVEVTRAIGEDGGQNERVTQELLELRGIAPYGQPIEYEGKKHNRSFGENAPVARLIETSEFSISMQEAFNKKNNKKYKDCWLIISVPGHFWLPELLYKSCLDFWGNIGQNSGVFKRIFAVSEERIKSHSDSDENHVWDSEHYYSYLHYRDL